MRWGGEGFGRWVRVIEVRWEFGMSEVCRVVMALESEWVCSWKG